MNDNECENWKAVFRNIIKLETNKKEQRIMNPEGQNNDFLCAGYMTNNTQKTWSLP